MWKKYIEVNMYYKELTSKQKKEVPIDMQNGLSLNQLYAS